MNDYVTPEGFTLHRPLLLPDVRDFAELFDYEYEWDHVTMTARHGVVPRHDLVPLPVLVDDMRIGPFLSANLAGKVRRSMAIHAKKITVDALAQPSALFAAIENDGSISFELFEHVNNGRVLVTAQNNLMTGSQYVAYIDPATIPTPRKAPAGAYVIKVDGDEMDHADTPAEAKRHRDALIYGGIGTEDNTTTEPRRVDTKRVGRTGVVWHSLKDADSGVTYEPWTDGNAIGFKTTDAQGRVEFIYLNPSGGSDDGVPTVVLYRGSDGNTELDAPVSHFEMGIGTAHDES